MGPLSGAHRPINFALLFNLIKRGKELILAPFVYATIELARRVDSINGILLI